MKKNKNYTIIDKSDIMSCWECSGNGRYQHTEKNMIECPLCKGTGEWKETHYIIIDEKNKIAIDSDNGS